MKASHTKKSLAALAVSGLLIAFAANAASDNGVATQNATAGSLQPTHGSSLCTAAINSTGTIASGMHVLPAQTRRVGVGAYQVTFAAGSPCAPATAASGHSRWVQIDTLTIGSHAAGSCTTADRAGIPNGVWVQCYSATGIAKDTSFFLFVAR